MNDEVVRCNELQEKLRDYFKAKSVEVRDDSHHHGGRGLTHLSLVIVSSYFVALSPLERERRVQKALMELNTPIYSVRMRLLTMEEAELSGIAPHSPSLCQKKR